MGKGFVAGEEFFHRNPRESADEYTYRNGKITDKRLSPDRKDTYPT
jgi:hypothetical protein